MRLLRGERAALSTADKGESLENVRVGVTLALPINRYNSVKLYGSTNVYSKTGADLDLLGIVWQLRWGGGLSFATRPHERPKTLGGDGVTVRSVTNVECRGQEF